VNTSTKQFDIQSVTGESRTFREDTLAVEEPLEIRVGFGLLTARQQESVAITMRTPGHDTELALGFLWTEGILMAASQVLDVRVRGFALESTPQSIVQVELHPDTPVSLEHLDRHFYTTSSCGVCGKTSLEAVHARSRYDLSVDRADWHPQAIHGAPERLREAQAVFDRTGGLHAAALFDTDGNLLLLREDVGRHNAVDKLIGAFVVRQELPLSGKMLLVSGRASFELVQKAVMGGIPLLAAVGAPSSLAVELAREEGLTLLGFVRGNRFNVYSVPERIADR
jgi:FdhD protein